MDAEAKAPNRMITLESADGQRFQVEEAVAMQSITIKSIIGDDRGRCCLPLPMIHGKVLEKVIHYWEHRVSKEEALSEWSSEKLRELELEKLRELDKLRKEQKKWDDDFAKSKNCHELISLLNAADFLNSQSLLDLLADELSKRMENMPVEQVREYFAIKNDFTPEEEEKLQAENPWLFQ